MFSKFLTIDEVAQTLNITRQTVSKYIAKKELKAIKINKSYRISDADFEAFVNSKFTPDEPQAVQFKKSMACSLVYDGKYTEQNHAGNLQGAYLQQTGQEHDELFNRFIYGDNLEVLKLIRPDLKGKVDLIYIDPPFGTGKNFVNIDNDHAYSDKLVNNEFLEFIRKRLVLLSDLLSESGSIYLHIDKKIGHYVKVIMDEIFGYENFINDITRIKCNPKNFARSAFGNYSDMILFYAKQRDKVIFNDIKEEMAEDKMETLFPKMHPQLGRYTTHPLHAPGITIDGDTGKEWNGLLPPKGRHWRYGREELSRLQGLGLIEWSDKGNPRKIVFADKHSGTKIQDVWEFKDKGLSYVDYPTQKNHELLQRIILNSSNPGSVVLDCFAGSGGTLLVADKLKRQWIGIDNSPNSLATVKENFDKNKIKCNYWKYSAIIKE